MASGRARQRKRFQSVPTTMAATWKLKADQAVILEGFVKHGTNDAVNWFVMPIRTPQGLIDHDVRFMQSPLESCSFNGGFWSYSANIEIKELQVVSREIYDLTTHFGILDLSFLLDAIEVTVNQNKFE
ncbi:hypothetical protein [Pseudoalteromonas arabiensis]|uniref:hypothetical protein n=1 Tax=Pseudoalteromonas arabiensis TaxID=874454 RepID=UPI000785368A|nr:hypothetical protein [Pseudoalteromonas arabiensis]